LTVHLLLSSFVLLGTTHRNELYISSDEEESDDIILMAGIFNPASTIHLHVESPAKEPPNGMSTASTNHPELNINGTNHCLQMGGFLKAEGMAICSAAHATAIVGVLQLALGHPDGIVTALGHNNRTTWVKTLFLFFKMMDHFPCFHRFLNKFFRDILVEHKHLLAHF
jgi:hypothetical protein